MKVKQLTKYITGDKDRTPVRVKVLVDNWYLCEFTCLRGNISNFNNRTAAEFYDDYDKVFTLKNILGSTVIGVEALRENVLSIEIDINEIYDFNESIRRNRYRGLREGDASLKTNYAVIVYDMNTGSYNLYTGTKKMCEQLYKDLFDFNIDDYDDDEKEDMYDWLYRRLNEFNCIERIDFRRGIDYRDNYSDGYNKYHIINYTKPRHPISLYL